VNRSVYIFTNTFVIIFSEASLKKTNYVVSTSVHWYAC